MQSSLMIICIISVEFPNLARLANKFHMLNFTYNLALFKYFVNKLATFFSLRIFIIYLLYPFLTIVFNALNTSQRIMLGQLLIFTSKYFSSKILQPSFMYEWICRGSSKIKLFSSWMVGIKIFICLGPYQNARFIIF